jgi:uncharacterized membrane protein
MNIFVALGFLVVLAALAAAGFFMLRSSGSNEATESSATARNSRMAKALAVRISVSVLLFICVLLAWKLGYIKPSGLPVAASQSK